MKYALFENTNYGNGRAQWTRVTFARMHRLMKTECIPNSNDTKVKPLPAFPRIQAIRLYQDYLLACPRLTLRPLKDGEQ